MKKNFINILILIIIIGVSSLYIFSNKTKISNLNTDNLFSKKNTIETFIPNLNNVELSFTTPKNNSKNISGKTPITFLWDSQLFPLQRSDIWQKKLEKEIKIFPTIKGHWSILGTSGILFEPQEDYPSSTEINITIPASLVGKETKLSFQTPRLEINSLTANNLIGKKPVTINFNQDIDLAKLSSQITFEPNILFDLEYGKTKRKKAKKESITKSILKITPKEDWIADTEYLFTLKKDTFAKNGNLPTEKEITKSFRTISPFTLEIDSPEYSKYSLQLNFSHKINSKDLVKYLKIEPEVSTDKWKKYTEQWTKDPYKSDYFYLNPINETWTPNQEYTITISPEITDIYGRKLEKKIKTKFTTIYQNRIIPLYFPDYYTVFSSKSSPKFVFKYTGKDRNLKIRLSKKLPNKLTESFNIKLEESTDKESIFEIDLAKNFPKIFTDNKITSGKYKIEIFEENKKWAERTSIFYFSDFAVGINKFADDRIKINAESFEGKNLTSEIKNIETWYNNNEIEASFAAKTSNITTTGQQTNAQIILVKLNNGEIGIGDIGFDNKISPYDTHVNFSPWQYQEKLSGVTITDRPLFRPGDMVYFKSIFREKENFGKNFPLKNVNQDKKQAYNVVIRNPFWEEVFNSSEQITTGGELDGAWEIPKDSPLGAYELIVSINNQEFSTTFHVQKFRKPKFLINLNFDKKRAILENKLTANLSANYAFGGSLANKEFTYKISLFGQEKNCQWWCDSQDKLLSSGEGILDKNGKFNIPIDLKFDNKENKNIRWNTLILNATVIASDDEKSSIEKSLPFFHSERVISLENGKYFYPPKSEITQTGTLMDLDKRPIKDTVSAELYLEKWVRSDRKGVNGDFYGDWQQENELINSEKIKSNEKGKFSWKLNTPEKAGNYFLRFTAKDKKGREEVSEKYFWISGNDFTSIRKNDQNRILKIFTDKDSYNIGEDVEIFFPIADFEINPETSQATIERGEILDTLPIDITNNTVKFKTESWMTPNVYLSVLLNGKDKDGNQDIRWGSVNVRIADETKKLKVDIQPVQKIYKPGDEIELKIKTSINNSPTSASVTISVVDETLLALMSRPKLDLWKKFMANLPLGVSLSHTLANFTSEKQLQEILDKIEKIKSRLALGHGGGGGDSAKGGEFKPRGDFRDTATFIAKIRTDKNGEAIAKFKAPDNLTMWNIWAIGHTDNNAFGQSESSTQVTLPMLVSEILPNGFTSGDEVNIGVLIRRNNDKQKSAKIKVKLNIPDTITAKIIEKEVIVKEEARVFFPIKIHSLNNWKNDFKEVEIGFEIKSDDGLTDALVVKRKIFPPKLTLTVADFFRVEDTTKIQILPDLVDAITSKLSINLSPSIVTKLENLINITKKTNYGCAEQRLSSSTSVLLQKDLDNTLGKDSSKINKEELLENKNYIEQSFVDDGFGYWNHSNRPSVWVSANILENTKLWNKFGAEFNEKKLKNTRDYLHVEILKICEKNYNWNCISDTTRNYAGAVLAQDNILTISDLDFLSKHAESLEAKIWWLKSARILITQGNKISPTSNEFKKEAWTEIQNNMKIRDRYIFWEESYRDFYSQNERLTALILEELILSNKFTKHQHKIARYLIESKGKNLSGNTSMKMLKTLKLYTEKYEIKNADAQVVVKTSNKKELINDNFTKLDDIITYEEIIKDKEFNGIEIIPKNNKSFYADVSLEEVLPTDKISPVSKGFFLERDIFELDDKELSRPIKKLELGKNYIVRLRIVTNASHRQVALVDYAPAGAEFINLEFGNSDQTLQSYINNEQCYGWCRPKFDHQEFHETSARFFTDYLPAGTHEIKYLIQARISGEFQVLPAKIEEMYFPEIFATTQGEIIEIKQ